jgi:hypothetical protein
MGRLTNMEIRLPPMVYGEVYAMARSRRYTIQDMVLMVRERGYIISQSAMGRFKKRVEGPEGDVRRWMSAHPEQTSKLAALLKSNPAFDFSSIRVVPAERAE